MIKYQYENGMTSENEDYNSKIYNHNKDNSIVIEIVVHTFMISETKYISVELYEHSKKFYKKIE